MRPSRPVDPSLIEALSARLAVAEARLASASRRLADIRRQIDDLAGPSCAPPDAAAAMASDRNLRWRQARRHALRDDLALARADQAHAGAEVARRQAELDAFQTILDDQRRDRIRRTAARADENLRHLWTLRTPRPPDGRCR